MANCTGAGGRTQKQVQHDDDRTTQCICKRAAAPGWATYFDIIVKYDMAAEAPMESALAVRDSSALGR